MRPLRILHVQTRYRRGGGAERNLLHFAECQRQAGADVHIAVGAESDLGVDASPVPVHEVKDLVRRIDPLHDLRAVVQLRNLIRAQRFDVVHTHESKAGVLGRVAARGVSACIVHTVHMSSFGAGYAPAASGAFLAAERFCARFTDLYITVGTGLREQYLRAGVGRPEQYRVIHSPIDIPAFLAVRDTPDMARVELRSARGIEGRYVLLSVGALERRKRVDLLLDRLAPLLRCDVQLLIAGEGRERAALEAHAQRLGVARSVRFMGHVDDVPLLMALGDVLVHASTSEGVPQVVIQALAAGLPVAATDVTGLREIANAPVTILPPSGRGMADATIRLLSSTRPVPVAAECLLPWVRENVANEVTRWTKELGEGAHDRPPPRDVATKAGGHWGRRPLSLVARSWREGITDADTHAAGYGGLRRGLAEAGIADVRGLRVLDIGCGERAPLALLLASDGATVDGIDLEPVVLGLRRPWMWVRLTLTRGAGAGCRCIVHDAVHTIRYWRRLAAASGRPLPFGRVRLRQADAVSLPFPSGSFDLVVSSAVWEHLSDVPAATRELNRVLAPDGLAVIQIALFSGLEGGHHGEWHSVEPRYRSIRAWDHLYPDHLPFPVYLNEWRDADYRRVFERELEVVRWEDGESRGREYLTPEVRSRLGDYSERELLLSSISVWARKRSSATTQSR